MQGGELEEVTIAGEIFKIDTPYTEGHPLTSGEASALNQVRHENLRNNFAKRVKDAKEAGTFDLAAFQTQLDDLAAKYEFGVRVAGARGPSVDPVKREALKIGFEWVSNKLKAQGKTIGPKGNHTAADVREATEKLLPKHPEWMESARTIVEQRKAASADAGGEEVDLASLMADNDSQAGDGSSPAEAA